MCENNVVTVREMFAESNRKSILSLFTLTAMPSKGDDRVEKQKDRGEEGRKYFFVFIEGTAWTGEVLLTSLMKLL